MLSESILFANTFRSSTAWLLTYITPASYRIRQPTRDDRDCCGLLVVQLHWKLVSFATGYWRCQLELSAHHIIYHVGRLVLVCRIRRGAQRVAKHLEANRIACRRNHSG